MKFNPQPVRCVIEGGGHSATPGRWPAKGDEAQDVCSNHMANFCRAVKALADKTTARTPKLWWAGRRPTK